MHIERLDERNREAWLHCLEPWSPEARLGRDRRAAWYERVKDRGLIVELAIDDDGAVAGMIQALPIEESFVDGEGLYQILCIWVHGHRQGIGKRQGRGLGRALLAAVEAEALARGAKGMAAWGILGPFWMRAAWFMRHGYRRVDRNGLAVLLFKPFAPDARAPRWFRDGPVPAPATDAVEVVCYNNGWCSAQNATCERALRAAAEFGERARCRVVDTSARDVVRSTGFSDALFVDGRPVRTGPPPSQEGLERRIAWRAWLRRWRPRVR